MKKIKPGYMILAIDTSCDETSVAVTQDDRVLANIVASQVTWHRQYGGVVPNIAKRMHQQLIEPALKQALWQARVKDLACIDAVAVTVGPGLAPALEVGVAKAKKLALKLKKPLIAVNHLEGHLLSSLIKNSRGNLGFKPCFPLLGLLVSGGHTQLVLMKDFGDYELLGETLDDAAGEAFDKVAKMLDLGYPGGPIISELAKQGQPKYDLPVPMMRSPGLDFSFSGLKTACLYRIQNLESRIKKNQHFYCDFSASFEAAVSRALMVKLKRAIIPVRPKQIVLGGGVINNLRIRRETRRLARQFNLKVFLPYSKKLLTDNAAMIGVCAWYQARRGDFVQDIKKLDRQPGLNFE